MIRVLDKSISDKIAAGEVIERPLSAVKELVENSIDAGADNLTVEIKEGGKTYIRVTDNGSGIAPSDIRTAFLRHATSKIFREEDLDSIKSLGFRGEALASIAAVAKVEIVSRKEGEDQGVRARIEGGEFLSEEASGCPLGTTIVIRDLFFNTPARRKFLKADAQEATPIIDFISDMALGYPKHKFRLINNDKTVFASNGRGDQIQNIALLYGGDLANHLLPVAFSRDEIKIKGYVSDLNISRTNKKLQIFFVNNRVVENKELKGALEKAYEDRLPSGRNPISFISIYLPPEKTDVNIHPNKLSIKFDDEKYISGILVEAVKKSLTSLNAVPNLGGSIESPAKIQGSINMVEPAITFPEEIKILNRNRNEDENENSNEGRNEDRNIGRNEDRNEGRNEDRFGKKEIFSYISGESQNQEEIGETFNSNYQEEGKISNLIILGSLFDSYILAKDSDNIYLIDQHAAHERVLYESLTDKSKRSDPVAQNLLIPLVIDLPRTVIHFADRIKCELNNMGFETEDFGSSQYIIKTMPSGFTLTEGEKFIKEYMNEIGPGLEFESESIKDSIIMKACKGAVKAKDSLSREEMEFLLKDLEICNNPYNCPHGRPVFVKLTKHNIERLFKRI